MLVLCPSFSLAKERKISTQQNSFSTAERKREWCHEFHDQIKLIEVNGDRIYEKKGACSAYKFYRRALNRVKHPPYVCTQDPDWVWILTGTQDRITSKLRKTTRLCDYTDTYGGDSEELVRVKKDSKGGIVLTQD